LGRNGLAHGQLSLLRCLARQHQVERRGHGAASCVSGFNGLQTHAQHIRLKNERAIAVPASAMSTTVYWPCATLSFELELELSLDLPMDADELPMDVDDALDADEVLSAITGAAPRHNTTAVAKGRADFKNCCMGAC